MAIDKYDADTDRFLAISEVQVIEGESFAQFDIIFFDEH